MFHLLDGLSPVVEARVLWVGPNDIGGITQMFAVAFGVPKNGFPVLNDVAIKKRLAFSPGIIEAAQDPTESQPRVAKRREHLRQIALPAHYQQGTSWLQPLKRATPKVVKTEEILTWVGCVGDDGVHRLWLNRVCGGHVRANETVSVGHKRRHSCRCGVLNCLPLGLRLEAVGYRGQ